MLQLKLIRKNVSRVGIRIITLIMSMHNNKPFINRKKTLSTRKKHTNKISTQSCTAKIRKYVSLIVYLLFAFITSTHKLDTLMSLPQFPQVT